MGICLIGYSRELRSHDVNVTSFFHLRSRHFSGRRRCSSYLKQVLQRDFQPAAVQFLTKSVHTTFHILIPIRTTNIDVFSKHFMCQTNTKGKIFVKQRKNDRSLSKLQKIVWMDGIWERRFFNLATSELDLDVDFDWAFQSRWISFNQNLPIVISFTVKQVFYHNFLFFFFLVLSCNQLYIIYLPINIRNFSITYRSYLLTSQGSCL